MTTRNAFTMVELIFVIVVLGILAAIAVPKLAASRSDAEIAKGRSDLAAIRSSIMNERQTRLFKGDSSWMTLLDNAGTGTGEQLFGGTTATLLSYAIVSANGSGHWMKTTAAATEPPKYEYTVDSTSTEFTYYDDNGTFECTDSCEYFQ